MPVAYARAPKRPLELAADDGRRLCQPDHARPFSSVHDAVNRLLPFHVRACRPPACGSLSRLLAQPLPTLGSLRVPSGLTLVHGLPFSQPAVASEPKEGARAPRELPPLVLQLGAEQ